MHPISVAAMGRERFNGFGYQADNSKRIRPGQPSQKDNVMNKTFSRISILFVSSVLLAALPLAAADAKLSNIERQVRHELVMLPYYGVFDNFTFRVDGSKVTLMGEVTRPTLKTSAEKVVAQLEGVEQVDNQIKVLPVSPNDDRVRVAVYRAIDGLNAGKPGETADQGRLPRPDFTDDRDDDPHRAVMVIRGEALAEDLALHAEDLRLRGGRGHHDEHLESSLLRVEVSRRKQKSRGPTSASRHDSRSRSLTRGRHAGAGNR
jgi:hypothetical protein